MDDMESTVRADREDLIEGRNAVAEALRAGRTIDKLFVARGETDRALGRIVGKARERGIVVTECDRRKLDAMSVTHAHQGVIAQAAVREYCSLDDILSLAAERGEDPFVVVCDEIADPHNLGAILRTAECAGVHGVVIPKRRSAGLTHGLWVYGTDADADAELWSTSLTGGVCLVIGSEGFGMSRLVRENCDVTVSIPLRGKVSSLNASAAAAVMIYEVVRQRAAAGQ